MITLLRVHNFKPKVTYHVVEDGRFFYILVYNDKTGWSHGDHPVNRQTDTRNTVAPRNNSGNN